MGFDLVDIDDQQLAWPWFGRIGFHPIDKQSPLAQSKAKSSGQGGRGPFCQLIRPWPRWAFGLATSLD